MKHLFRHCILAFSFLLAHNLWAQPPIQLTQFATAFNSPVDIANAGDSRLFVVEQSGNIRIVDSLGNKLPTPFLSKSVTSGGERGLLGLAFDPAYATNGFFYVYYSQGSNSIISRFSVSGTNPDLANPASEQVILTISQPFSNHNGGDIAFGPDGYLYIGLGDGGSGGDPGNRSQDGQELLGKMLRIDVSSLPYTVPADNPFVGDTTILDEIWAIGLRNPWRWSFDRLTGDIWIADVGQSAKEEINFAPAGSAGINYGWRCYEGNNTYNTTGCGPATNYDFPAYDYPRGLGTSVTGGFVYRGQSSPQLEGIYFFGDYGSGRLWGIWPDTASPGNWVVHEYFNTAYDWSTFGEDAQGELYGADYNTGNIYRIESVCANFGAALTVNDASCPTASDGSISLNPTNGSGPFSVLWSNGDTALNVSNLAAGTYTFMITDANGCTFNDTVAIDAAPVPTPVITSQGGLVFCSGGSVALSANSAPGGFAYQWLRNGLAIPGSTGQTLNVSVGGDYQVTYTGPCEADTSVAVQVQVVPVPPSPVLSGDTAGTYCSGETVMLQSSTAPANFSIQWFLDGVPINGANADTLLVTTSGDYSVRFEGPCNSPPSSSATFTIENTPAAPVFSGPGQIDICAGDTAEVVAPSAPSGYGYQWYRNGSLINGATQPTLRTAEPGDYSLVFTGQCPSEESQPLTLNLQPLPEPIINQIGDTLTADQGIAWQWFLNGNPIPGATSQSWVATASGSYTVQMTDASGCTGISEAVEVTLTSLEELLVGSYVQVAPNPAREQVSIGFELQKVLTLEVSLTDLNGRVISTQTVVNAQGPVEVNFSLEALSAGVYLIRLDGPNLRYSTRLVVAD